MIKKIKNENEKLQQKGLSLLDMEELKVVLGGDGEDDPIKHGPGCKILPDV